MTPREAAGPRYSAVPWLWDSDFREGMPAQWTVDCGRTIHSCWSILLTGEALLIRATRGNGNDGGVITLAISDTLRLDTRDFASLPIHSNPRRAIEGPDGYSDTDDLC